MLTIYMARSVVGHDGVAFALCTGSIVVLHKPVAGHSYACTRKEKKCLRWKADNLTLLSVVSTESVLLAQAL